MLLIFFNFNINIGNATIGLIPSFIGYSYMLKGVLELQDFSNRFVTIAPFVKIMAMLHLCIYVANLFGISTEVFYPFDLNSYTILVFAMALFLTGSGLYISYYIIMGIKDIESAEERDLNTGSLYSIWKITVLLWLVAYLALPMPFIAGIAIAVQFVVGVCYLLAFNTAKNLFYATKSLNE